MIIDNLRSTNKPSRMYRQQMKYLWDSMIPLIIFSLNRNDLITCIYVTVNIDQIHYFYKINTII